MEFSRRSLCSVAAALFGAASSLPAQVSLPAPFDPFPGGSAARYHFDLARNFFSSPADELARREKLRPRLERLAQLSRSLPQSAGGILAALALQDSLDLEVSRHATYLELRFYADTRQGEALRSAGQLQDMAGSSRATFDSALAAPTERHSGQARRGATAASPLSVCDRTRSARLWRRGSPPKANGSIERWRRWQLAGGQKFSRKPCARPTSARCKRLPGR